MLISELGSRALECKSNARRVSVGAPDESTLIQRVISVEPSKVKSAIVVTEGFVVWVVSWIGGEFFALRLIQMVPTMPLITADMISSPGISPLVASIYMWLRLRSIPTMIAKAPIFSYLTAGMILAWLVLLLQALVLGKEVSLAQEVLKTQSDSAYFLLALFILIAWGPFLEETLARGYFFETLRTNWGDPLALLMSSFLFVLFHGIFGGFGYGLVFIFLFSAAFTLVYIHGGVIPAALTHIFVNSYLTYLSMNP